jgi:hypothetical protein
LPYKVDTEVTTIRVDFDPWGGEYTYVELSWKLPLPSPQALAQQPVVLGAQPKNVAYKHVMHVYIPKENWVDQYKMWEKRKITIEDDGAISIEKVE